ncbi:MAG: succinate dehydrogenase assembly factor 2 [Legionellales bacterium]|nr:succinate dehydrogenase assembly factor 2 [Legionellales bacterium]
MKNDLKSSMVQWRCRRGMLELDTVLLSFFSKCYIDLKPTLKKDFTSLLEMSDPELFDILILQSDKIPEELQDIINLVRKNIL